MGVVDGQGLLPPLPAEFTEADVADDEPQDADEDDDADADGPDDGIGHLHLCMCDEVTGKEGVRQRLSVCECEVVEKRLAACK